MWRYTAVMLAGCLCLGCPAVLMAEEFLTEEVQMETAEEAAPAFETAEEAALVSETTEDSLCGDEVTVDTSGLPEDNTTQEMPEETAEELVFSDDFAAEFLDVSTGEERSGFCGKEDPETLSWSLSEDGVLTFAGSGVMQDWANPEEVPWYAYRNEIRQIVWAEGMKSVGAYAFYGCSALNSVEIG